MAQIELTLEEAIEAYTMINTWSSTEDETIRESILAKIRSAFPTLGLTICKVTLVRSLTFEHGIRDLNSNKFWRWRYATHEEAIVVRSQIRRDWIENPSNRERDLAANFVDNFEDTK